MVDARVPGSSADFPTERPIVAITLGDVAGIGPEVLVRAWSEPELHRLCIPVVIGSAEPLRRLLPRFASRAQVVAWDRTRPVESSPTLIPCLEATSAPVSDLEPGRPHAVAGQAAFDYLIAAIDLARSREVAALVTLPINKQTLHAAGLPYPGHTEILAERCGVENFAMMLYRKGLGVVHVTLHMALREALTALTTDAIREKIGLLDDMMRRLGKARPRIGVAAVNPHAGDGGIFGDEEDRVIRPAVESAASDGLDVAGPLPADTLFVRAHQGEFDGVVAMYHDQGHIALKLLGWREAVNVTLGLPIVRVSVAHGTAYDIVGRDGADPTSFFEAVRVATALCRAQVHGG